MPLEDGGQGRAVVDAVAGQRAVLLEEPVRPAGCVEQDDPSRIVGQVQERVRQAGM